MPNYLYNGVELPDINTVWTDKEKYPYAYISDFPGFADTGIAYSLYLSDSPTVFLSSGSRAFVNEANVRDYLIVPDELYASGYNVVANTWILLQEVVFEAKFPVDGNPTRWTNFDILNEDGSVYLTASDPIPITPSNPFCLRSWLTGFALGLAGKSLPYSKVIREPVAYLYNGIRLPALPEWDKETYPYAVLVWNTVYEPDFHTCLYLSTVPLYKNTTPLSSVFKASDSGSCIVYLLSGGAAEFERYKDLDITFSAGGGVCGLSDHKINWANYDVLTYGTETIYLAASDPVPIYE